MGVKRLAKPASNINPHVVTATATDRQYLPTVFMLTCRTRASAAGSRRTDMSIGGTILDEIDVAIRLRDKALLILSEHSITERLGRR
jgi:hypothetical protein